MKATLACVAFLVALSGCRVQPSAPTAGDIQDSEKGSAAFLKTLTEAQRKSYDDLKADWLKDLKNDPAAAKKNYAHSTLQSQMILGEMGYGTLFTGIVDRRTQIALSRYQKDKGIFNSGNIDPLTYFALDEDEQILDHRTVMTASYFFLSGTWNRYFSADGAWDYENKDDTYVQSSTIQCDKSLRTCTQSNGIEMSLFGMTSIQTNIADFSVTKWDDFEIIADLYDPPCEKDELEIVRDKQTVTMHMISIDKENAYCKAKMGDATVLEAHLLGWERIGQSREEVLRKKRASLLQFSESARKIIEAAK